MADDVVLYEVQDRVALVTLNRPERLNAWTGPMGTAYFDYLEEAVADPHVGAIVVTGAGRGFCSGADMQGLQVASTAGHAGATAETRHITFPLSIPKLMVAAINGPCAGMGLVQALMCDVRFAASGAKFTTAFARRGLIAEHGVSWLLPHIVGTSHALDLLLSARVVMTDEALSMGLVNRSLEPGALVEEALAYARDVAINSSPASVAAIKSMIYRHFSMDVAAASRDADEIMARSLKGPDFKEGVDSFVEHRPPAFAPLGQGTDLS